MLVFLKQFFIYCAALLVGSIPVGYYIAQLHGIDITKTGSGNIGATNVARALGLPYFFLVFFLDAGKAFLFLWLISYAAITLTQWQLAALFLLLGNGRSLLLPGRGGKGVATTIGILCALQPWYALLFIIFWIIGIIVLRNVGISSIIATIALVVYVFFYVHDYSYALFFGALLVWIPWRHTDNIKKFLSQYIG